MKATIMIQSDPVNSLLRKIPSEFKLVIALFLIMFGLSYVIGGADAEREKILYLSSYETGMYGTSKFFNLAEKTGKDTVQYTKSFTDGIPENTRVIFALSPADNYSRIEIDNISRWVEDGGTFVFTTDMTEFLDFARNLLLRNSVMLPVEDIYFPMVAKDVLLQDQDVIEVTPENSKLKILFSEMDIESNHSIFADVENIHTPLVYSDKKIHRLYFDLTGELELPDHDETSPFNSEQPPDEESSQLDEQYYLDLQQQWDILALDNEKPAIIEADVSQGHIIAISNPLVLSNGFIETADNVVFAYNLLSLAGDGSALIDEYRHGFSTETITPISQTGWGRMLYFLFFVGIVAIYSKSVRFIPPKSVPPPIRRSQVEYLRSMAQIFRRAGARSLIANILYREIRNLPPDQPDVKMLKTELKSLMNQDNISRGRLLDAYNNLRSLEERFQVKTNKS